MRTLTAKSAVAMLLLPAMLCALAACKSAPPPPPPPPPLKPPKISMSVTMGADVNPDLNGKAAPVVVRIYQLKDDAAFTGADFFALYDKEQATLGPALIERREFELAPGEQRMFDYPIPNDARFIGAIAAFRDIRNAQAQWRVVLPAPKQEPQIEVRKIALAVAVERLKITLSTMN